MRARELATHTHTGAIGQRKLSRRLEVRPHTSTIWRALCFVCVQHTRPCGGLTSLKIVHLQPGFLPHLECRAQPGFIPPMRIAKGGAIAFGDYDTAQQATDCMLNLHNLKFPGWNGEGLKISYDKGWLNAPTPIRTCPHMYMYARVYKCAYTYLLPLSPPSLTPPSLSPPLPLSLPRALPLSHTLSFSQMTASKNERRSKSAKSRTRRTSCASASRVRSATPSASRYPRPWVRCPGEQRGGERARAKEGVGGARARKGDRQTDRDLPHLQPQDIRGPWYVALIR